MAASSPSDQPTDTPATTLLIPATGAPGRALPSGTVTFLFTDIEGSTRLLQRLGDDYAAILTTHQRLLRQAIEAHGGVEVDTQGDSFFVVFATARDAVAAAAAATRALAAYAWPEGNAVRVRMGLHTGAPQRVGDGYVGLDVHRAARIAAAGHGGQILLSQTTRDLCMDSLAADVALLEMGEATLKDLQQPERLYQMALTDLPHDFPPLKTLDRAPHNLPIQPTPFLGRREVVQRLVALLEQDDVRLLTLMGAGGIGKTRVALEVAAQAADQFPDGVFFVNLAPLTTHRFVAGTIARTLNLRDGGSLSAEEILHASLRERRMLLVMDNFESVIEAAPTLARLLAACPHVKTLVTSRIALRLRGEHEFSVPPLDMPDPAAWAVAPASSEPGAPPDKHHKINVEELSRHAAIRLFIERAREVRPDFQLTTTNASTIVEICWRLDGLPLAIELAAARLKLLSPQAILTRLSKRLALLTDGPRDQPERHHTLRAAIAWSYELLRPGERAVFRRIAVFAGGWTFEAAEAVCGPDVDALSELSALIDQSLISQREESDGEPRFSQLETIREFAAEELETNGEADSVREAHARYYIALAERTQREARGPDAHLWLARLEREHDNFRAALSWARDTGELTLGLRLATALSSFWQSHGHVREGARWLRDLLTLAEARGADTEGADAELRAIYAWGLGRAGSLLVYLGDYELAAQLQERCLTTVRALGDRDRELRTLNMLGLAAHFHNDHETAMRWFNEGLTIARAARLDDLVTLFLNNLGDVAYYGGDLEQAASCYRERLAFGERNGDQAAIAVGRQNVGRTLLRQGQIEAAAASLRQSLAAAWDLRDPRRIAEGLEGLAALAGRLDEGERAALLLGAAAQLRETLGTPQPALERGDTELAVASAKAAVGDGAWAAAFSDGREQALEQTIGVELGSPAG